jgi:DNA topoisomerase-1
MSDILDFLNNIKSMYKEYKHNININNVQLGGNNIQMDNNIVQTGGERAESYDIVHYNDGIARKKEGKNFIYYYIDNNKPVSASDMKRINALKIPPAWIDVWVSRKATSSIQAIGMDVKGRKQYKYNDHHIKEAEKEKFILLIDFIKDLPKLEKILRTHQHLNPYDKFKVISTVVLLIKKLNLRIGKRCYEAQNGSSGASSLKKKHVKISGNNIQFNFKAKSNKRVSYSLNNQNISEHLTMLMKLEGPFLFKYIDENGNIKNITDVDVNDYIQQYMGQNYSAKIFRTLSSNLSFISALLKETSKRSPKNEKIIKKNIVNSIKISSYHLRHTASISKKSYIMNFCIDMYQNNPDFFVKRKNDDPNDVLMEVLLLYKKTISKEKN